MRARRYPVTTIGDPELGDFGDLGSAIEGELLEEKAPCACKGCGKPASKRIDGMHGLEDLSVLYNPFAWAAQKLLNAGLAKLTGKDDAAQQPGALDQLANALGIDPVEVAIELTGYSGLGRYWPVMQVVGGAAAIGGAAYLATRAIRGRKTKRKGKR